ncbi:MAG: phosphoglycerate dehydrogenase [Pseudomonadales bacterium]|nr:phosphoglycerate dehydrogenase [Pseudomonadales bacterium]
MYRICTLNQISLKGLEQFPRDQYELASEIGRPDAILVRSHKLGVDDITPDLKAIARAGAGTNNVPVSACTEKGVPVFNTPGANANAVKELVLTGLLLSSRGIVPGIGYVNSLTDIDDATAMGKLLEQEKKRFRGREIAGKTLGVVGLGAIGSMVTEVALQMGMKVVGFDPSLSVEAAWRVPNQVEKMENLPSLLARSDFVSLHVPAIEPTKDMINTDAVAAMKEGAVLLNFARESIVNTAAIVDGLESGKAGQYVTDFPHPDLLGRDNVILMPHIGASTNEAEENCAVMAARQLIDFLENGNIRNSVNFPDLHLERNGPCRIAFSNRNVPKVLGNVLSVLADRDINVVDMLNKSREDVAYNLIDIECAPPQGLAEALFEIEGVINVRLICNGS